MYFLYVTAEKQKTFTDTHTQPVQPVHYLLYIYIHTYPPMILHSRPSRKWAIYLKKYTFIKRQGEKKRTSILISTSLLPG